jgi:hypothetical protein
LPWPVVLNTVIVDIRPCEERDGQVMMTTPEPISGEAKISTSVHTSGPAKSSHPPCTRAAAQSNPDPHPNGVIPSRPAVGIRPAASRHLGPASATSQAPSRARGPSLHLHLPSPRTPGGGPHTMYPPITPPTHADDTPSPPDGPGQAQRYPESNPWPRAHQPTAIAVRPKIVPLHTRRRSTSDGAAGRAAPPLAARPRVLGGMGCFCGGLA